MSELPLANLTLELVNATYAEAEALLLADGHVAVEVGWDGHGADDDGDSHSWGYALFTTLFNTLNGHPAWRDNNPAAQALGAALRHKFLADAKANVQAHANLSWDYGAAEVLALAVEAATGEQSGLQAGAIVHATEALELLLTQV